MYNKYVFLSMKILYTMSACVFLLFFAFFIQLCTISNHYILFENNDGRMYKIKYKKINGIGNNNTTFIMPAGGGDITEYTYITEKLNAKTIFLVDHNTLDTNTNFIMRLATRSLNFLNKSPLFHDLFNNSEIKWGSRLFWDTHFNFLDKMVQVSGVLNEQKRTILIGHSHSADAAFRVGKKYSDKMQPIKVVLIAPCFNLNRNYKEAHEIEVHVIFSGNETDGCARKYENKIIANRLTKNNGKIYTLDNATHYSMIEQSLFSMHNHKTLPESRESVIRIINNLLDDKQ